jgi:hypothetical protein
LTTLFSSKDRCGLFRWHASGKEIAGMETENNSYLHNHMAHKTMSHAVRK